MNIRQKLIAVTALVSSLLFLLAVVLMFNSRKIIRQLEITGVKYTILEAESEARLSINKYLISTGKALLLNEPLSEKEIIRCDRDTKMDLEEWGALLVTIKGDAWCRIDKCFNRYEDVKEKCNRASGLVSRALALKKNGRTGEALKAGKEAITLFDASLESIDEAMGYEIEEIEQTYNNLLMTMGVMPWSGENIIRQANIARFAPKYTKAVDDARVDIVRQMSATIEYLMHAEGYSVRRVNARGAMDNLVKVVRRQHEMGYAISGTGDEILDAENLAQRYRDALRLVRKIQGLGKAGRAEEAFALMRDTLDPLIDTTLTPLSAHIMLNARAKVINAHKRLLALAASMLVKMLVAIVLFVSFIIFFVWYGLIRGIISSLEQIRKGTEAIRTGRLEHRIRLKSDDELGRLAASFDQMAGDLQGMRDEIISAKEYNDNILRTMGDALFVVAADGTIRTVNAAACALLGYREAELRGHSFGRIVEGEAGGAHIVGDIFRDRQLPTREVIFSAKEGGKIPVILSSSIMRDKNGLVQGAVCVAKNITERKKVEETLAETSRLNKIILDTVDAVCLLLRPHTREIVASNKAAAVAGAVPGKTCFATWGKRETPCPWCRAPEIWETREAQHQEIEVGDAFFDMYWIPVSEDLYMHYAIDITDRKRAERDRLNLNKLESLGTLAGGIAHDFNNLLSLILGNISFARVRTKNKEVKEFLADSEDACERAVGLTHQLLAFSKGSLPVRKVVSIRDLFEQVTNLFLAGSNVNVVFSMKNPWPVEIDENQIGQVIQNLVVNAQQAMPEGGTIEIGSENVLEDHKKSVKISVQDNGIGIPEKYLTRIFDPYFTTKQKGSGLGLAVAYTIIQNHGGRISVDSHAGRGTTFYIWLPASERGVIVKAKEEEKLAVAKTKKRVLILDDEEAIRDFMVKTLSMLGYEAHSTKEGAETLSVYQEALTAQEPFDAVILDLIIPGGKGGKETMQELLALDPGARVIVSSGYTEDPLMSRSREHGAAGVLKKPYKVQDLAAVVAEVLGEV